MSVSYGGDSITFADNSTISSGWTGQKNKIINGAMRIDQRYNGTSFTNSTGLEYTLDRWRTYGDTSGKFKVQQVTSNTAASNYESGCVPSGSGLTHSAKITSNSAHTISTGSNYRFEQSIEGHNIADLNWGTANAKPITISFWVKSSLTGVFGLAAWNGGGGTIVSFATSYTINSANTWEYKTVTIPGATTGVWDIGVNQGIVVQWSLGTGSTYLTSPMSVWPSPGTLYTGVTGQTNLVATNGATLYLTGVQVEKGSTSSSFEYRSYGTEFALCQRYYQKMSGQYTKVGIAYGASSTRAVSHFFLRTSMRTDPSVKISSTTDFRVSDAAANRTSTNLQVNTYGTRNDLVGLWTDVASGLTTGATYEADIGSSTGWFAFDAEI